MVRNFRALAIIILAFCIILMTGCDDSFDELSGNGLLIGVSVNSSDDYRTAWVNSFRDQAEEKGHRVIVLNAEEDASKQLSDIENLLLQKPDAMVVHAYDGEAIGTGLKNIKENNIPCVLVDFPVSSEFDNLYDVRVAADVDDTVGVLTDFIKEWEAENPDEEPIIGCIFGSYDYSSGTDLRYDAFCRLLGIDETYAKANAMWSAQNAILIAEDWAVNHREINIYACMSDEMAIGAIQAINSAGINKDDVLVLGIDGLESSYEYIQSGYIDCTSARDVDKETLTALNICEGLTDGKTYEKNVDPQAVYALTKDNIDEFIASRKS